MMLKTARIVVCLSVLAIGTRLAGQEKVSDWSQWRGPTRDGKTEDARWGSSLDGLLKSWRVELGPGYSGPIVVGNRVFVTETRDQSHEVVRALDRRTGREIWKTEWPGAMSVPFFAKANGDWIRATPAYSAGRLYIAGMRDVLVCLDAASGREQWRVDFPKQLKSTLPSFGFVCSPLVEGDAVYVQAGGGVAKIRADSGEIVWLMLRDGGGMFGSAFSSPVIAELAGKRQLVVQTRSQLAGLDLVAGKTLWTQDVPAFRGMNILTPTVWDDRVFTSSYGGGSFCFEVAAQGDEFVVRKVWKNKVQGYMSSPLLIGGNLYLHLRNQRFTSLTADDGTQHWTTTPFGKYWSMAACGNRILALDERGELLLIAADNKQFTLLDRREITEHPAWAHIAVAGEEVFIRDLAGLTAYRWEDKK